MRRTLLLIALAVLLAAPARAHAALTIGAGSEPGLAVDAAGTAYIAWYDDTTSQLHYCRLPRNAAACDVTLTLTPDGQTLSRPAVVLDGADVYVYTPRYGLSGRFFDETFAYLSTDHGATFTPTPSAAGTLVFDESAAFPGGGLIGATNADSGGGLIQYTQYGGFTSAQANLFPATYLYNGTVAFYGGTSTAIAVFTDATSDAQFRVSQSPAYNDPASWNPAAPIAGFTSYPKLADGPKGLFLLSGADGGGVQVRRFNGAAFLDPVLVLPGVQAPEASITQDAGGRLHVVGPRFAADGIHLDYAYSDDGSNWTVSSLAIAGDEQTETRVAAAGDHGGVAVWRASSTSAIEVSSLAAAAAAPPPPPAVTPTPTPAPSGPPAPVFDSTVVAGRVSGTVLVKAKGASRFVPLTGSRSVPLGSTIDTRKGRITLAAISRKGGPVQTAQFYDGIFKVTRTGSVTQLALVEALASCRKGAHAAAAKKKPKTRKLWGDGSGSFSTRGQYSAATVRGTRWLVQDSCAGTLTQVKKGVVSVRDFARRTNVVIRAGKHYLAKARR